jgi:hypothetical protein
LKTFHSERCGNRSYRGANTVNRDNAFRAYRQRRFGALHGSSGIRKPGERKRRSRGRVR